MFGIGGFELFIILIFGFLIFGPEKLPEVAQIVGKGIARFRQAQNEMNDVIKSTDIYDPNSDEPFKDPMIALDKLAQHQEEKRAGKSATAPSNQEKSDAADSGDKAKQPEAGAKSESFTERKARYERERAARKAAEAEAAQAEAEAKPSEAADASDASANAASQQESLAEGGEQ